MGFGSGFCFGVRGVERERGVPVVVEEGVFVVGGDGGGEVGGEEGEVGC